MSSDRVFVSTFKDVPAPKVPICCYLLGQLQKNLLDFGDEIFMEDYGSRRKVLYSEVVPRVKSIVYALKEAGFKKGSHLFISSANTVDIPLLQMAVWCCEGVFGSQPPTNPLETLMEHSQLMQATFLLCDEESAPKFLYIASMDDRIKVFSLTPIPGCFYISSDNSDACSNELHEDCDQKDLDSPILIGFSSGTTGKPKPGMHTHRSAVNMVQAVRVSLKIPTLLPFTGKKVLSIYNMGFMSGILSNIVAFIDHQHNVMVSRRMLAAEDLLPILAEIKPWCVFMLPHQVHMMAKHPNLKLYELSSLEGIHVTGSTLDPELCVSLCKQLPQLKKVISVYSMSEIGLIASRSLKGNWNPNTNTAYTCGKLGSTCMLKIADLEDSRSLPAGEVGEICVKNASMMKGYFGNPQATEEFFKDGWAHTGDAGYIDEDGFLYLTGRIKEIIKYNSVQVSPADIEARLLSHPAVQSAVVVGKPDKIYGELPTAFVVLQDGFLITENDLCSYVNDRVQDGYKLRGGVRFIEAIPYNPSGKPMRATLRKLLGDESDIGA